MYALNTKTLAVSEYSLSLSVLSVLDGRCYGVLTGGMMELTGSDDDGTDIDAYIQTGKMDMNDPTIKRYPRLYLGGTASDGLSATITTEEKGVETDNVYSAVAWAGNLHEQVVKLARGSQSRHVQVKIENVDGGTMTLDQADVLVEGRSRRVSSS